MNAKMARPLSEIFQLLDEQDELLKHWPYTAEQLTKDKEISTRIRELVDQICAEQSATSALVKVDLEELISSIL
jgi:hypothetical protein